MSTVGTWLLVGAAGVGVVAVAWRLVGWLMTPPPQWHPFEEVFLSWDIDQQHAYLRHPVNQPRCVCGSYCVWYGVVIGRDQIRHDGDRCQPLAEVIL